MARTNKKGGNSAGLKGWSAFTNAEKGLDNTSRPDGRAGSSAYQIANQYRQHKVSSSDRADAIARSRMIDRKYADRSPKERAMLSTSSKYQSYGAKDEWKRMKDKGTWPMGGGSKKAATKKPKPTPEKQVAKAESQPIKWR